MNKLKESLDTLSNLNLKFYIYNLEYLSVWESFSMEMLIYLKEIENTTLEKDIELGDGIKMVTYHRIHMSLFLFYYSGYLFSLETRYLVNLDIHIYIHTWICILALSNKHSYIHMCICTFTDTYVCVWHCVCIYVCVFVHVYTCMCVCACIVKIGKLYSSILLT